MAKQTIGEFLATLRKANGYTQQEVADRLGISNRTLSGWECDKVLPDILLLPVLAELYGVTVDEILAGERISKDDVPLSNKSERNLYKNRLARFGTQVWILIGVSILGGLLALSGILGLGFIPLIIGLVMLFASAFTVLALWRSAESSVNEDSEFYGAFCILLSKRFSACYYVTSAFIFLAAIVALFYALLGYPIKAIDIPLVDGLIYISIAILISFAFFVVGWVIYKKALAKWGGDTARRSITKSRRYFWTVGFWGMFPFVLAVIVAIVLCSGDFEKHITVYENESVDQFVRHMESIEHDGKVYYFPLSELAREAKNGDKFDLGDGFTATYWDGKFEFGESTFTDNGVPIIAMHTIKPYFMHGEDRPTIITFYVLRYYNPGPGVYNTSTAYYKRRENYYIERVGDGMAYIHYTVSDYSSIGYTVASAVIVMDLIVCTFLCTWKRYEYNVKM